MDQTSNLKHKWLLGFILLVGYLLRICGNDFGLPHTDCRPDETTIIQISLGFFSGDLNPHFFNYPTFYMYFLAGIYLLYFFFRTLTGETFSEIFFALSLDSSPLYSISRHTSALFGVLTILMLYYLTKLLLNQKTALLASFYFSLTYLHIRDSHFGTTDVPSTFFILIALLFLFKEFKRPKKSSFILTAFFTGLAISTKYSALFLLFPITLCHLLNSEEEKGEKKNKLIRLFYNQILTNKRFWLSFLFIVFFFLLFTPYAFLDFSQFKNDFKYETLHLLQGHHQVLLGQGWWYHLRYTLPYGMGWSLFLFALVGIYFHFRKDSKQALLLYSFPFLYYLSAGRGYTVFLRYMIPILPFLCIAASLITNMLLEKLPKRLSLLILLIPLLIVSPSLYRTLLLNSLLIKLDTRLVATEWVYTNIPAGETIYQPDFFIPNVQQNNLPNSSVAISYSNLNAHGQLQLIPSVETLKEEYRNTKNEGQKKELQRKIDGLQQLSHKIGYRKWSPESTLAKRGILPNYIIIQQSPLQICSQLPKGTKELLKEQYKLLVSVEGVELEAPELWYDQIDAFYLPFIGLNKVKRPGPNIYIYQQIGK